MTLKFVERGTEFFFDLGRMSVLGDVEYLAEIPVALLKRTHFESGIEPDLQQWDQGFCYMVL